MKRFHIKKIIVLPIILALVVLTMFGCGNSAQQPAPSESTQAVAPTETPATTATSAPEATATPAKPQPKIIRFGCSGLGSTDQLFMEGISNIINKYTDIKTSTMGTNGGVEIMQLLGRGELEAGFGASLNMVQALRKEAPFDKSQVPVEKMLQLFAFTTWQDPIVVLDDSGIKTYADLDGKNIALPPLGSGTNSMSQIILNAYGMTDKVKIESLDWQSGYDAMKDGRLSGWVANWANFMPSANLIDLEATRKYDIIPVDKDVMEKVSQANPGIFAYELGSEASPQNIKDGETVLVPGFSGIAIISSDISEESVYKMVKAIFAHVDDLTAIYGAFKYLPDVCMSSAVKDVPFHSGAAKALKELGLWQDGYKVYGE